MRIKIQATKNANLASSHLSDFSPSEEYSSDQLRLTRTPTLEPSLTSELEISKPIAQEEISKSIVKEVATAGRRIKSQRVCSVLSKAYEK